MKKLLLIIALFNLIKLNAQSLQWARSMGGSINDYGQSITTDASGNVFTTGYFTGTADFDPGVGTFTFNCIDNGDIFVSKLDAAGNFVWAKKFAGTGASGDTGEGITLDASGNIYVTGRFCGTADFDPGVGTYTLTAVSGFDIFVLKLDPSGNFVWAKRMNGSGTNTDIGKSITLDASGNVYTAGYYEGSGDFDPGSGTFSLTSVGGQDIFISKFDNSGNFIWAKSMGGAGFDRAYSIAIDPFGNVCTTGITLGGADFDPGAGTFNIANAGIFVSKLDGAGNFVWAKKMGTNSSSDFGYGIKTDPSGNIYTTGIFNLTGDFDPGVGVFNMTDVGGGGSSFISKLDGAGNFVWAKGLIGACQGFGIALDATGNVYTTGEFSGTTDFDPGVGTFTYTSAGAGTTDFFISKLDGSGNFVSALRIGDIYTERATSIALDASCNIYVTGNYNGTVDFDPSAGVTNLTSLVSADIFVLKLNCLPTSIKEQDVFSNGLVSVYPNPSNGLLNIQLKNSSSAFVEITNMLGQIVFSETFLKGKNTLNLEQLQSGMYSLKISENGKTISNNKIIIQK